MASRARVSSFSFTSSCWRAASHSCGDTIGGMFMVIPSFQVLVATSTDGPAGCDSPCALPKAVWLRPGGGLLDQLGQVAQRVGEVVHGGGTVRCSLTNGATAVQS